MSAPILVTAAALVDATGVRGTAPIRRTWRELGVDPLAGRIRFTTSSGEPLRDLRRLDPLSRVFVVAAEACDLAHRLPAELRTGTAVVLASSSGCLATDLRFERSLHADSGIEPALFPYTLPSTCLGEVAIRHGLRGPSICLSVAGGDEIEALELASTLLADGEADAALVLLGDWLPAGPSHAAKTRAAALLLEPMDPDTPHLAQATELRPAPLDWLDRALSPWRPAPI